MKTRKHIMLMTAVLMCALMLCSCKLAADEPAAPAEPTAEPAASIETAALDENATYYAEIDIADHGVITVALYGNDAPISVANFVKLANEGFYNGLIFHRVIPGFMIQGGCPDGTGMGGPGYSIKGEFAANGVKNPIKHKRGVISMARAMNPNSAGSQFFIMHQDAPHLDGQYAAFGHVVEGMETVDAIAATPTNFSDRPLDPQRIKSVTLVDEGEIVEPEKM